MLRSSEKFDPTAHFDESLTAKYDRRIRLFCPSYDALHQTIVHLFQPLPEHSIFLSAGAGTGAEIANLGKRFPSWRFVGVDASSDMLNACRQRVSESGFANRVDFFNGWMQDYRSPVPFDAASSVFVAHFIKVRDEKLAYFCSIAANLKPGGMFVIADLFGDKGSQQFERLLNSWLLSYASHGISAEEFAKDRAHIDRDVDFVPEVELVALLREAGFAPPVRFHQTFLFGGWVTTKNFR